MLDRRRLLTLGTAVGATLGATPTLLAQIAATPAPSLQPVIDYLTKAEEAAVRLGYGDPSLRPAYQRQALLLLSLAYVEVFGTRIDAPNWVPHIPFYLPWGSPNPDDNYYFVPIEAHGQYRLYGHAGTAPIAVVTLRTGGAHLGQINGRTLSEIDLTTLPKDKRGRFECLVSAQRPEGYRGAWFHLDPATSSLLLRSRTTNEQQTDVDCGIERLDVSVGPAFPEPQAAQQQLEMLCQYAARQNKFLLAYLNSVRARGGERGFIFDDQSAYGALVKQRYLMHLFSLAPEEALILESDVPETVQYWSVQLFDAFFSGIDNVGRQSACNHEQVRIDADRRVRLVVAARDIGAPNWLDTGGWPRAGLMWRWNDANRYPLPSVTRVPLNEVRSVLPAKTSFVSPEERRARIRAHARYTRRRGR